MRKSICSLCWNGLLLMPSLIRNKLKTPKQIEPKNSRINMLKRKIQERRRNRKGDVAL